MEDVLDEIAAGRRDRNTELAEFYFGKGDVDGLKKLVSSWARSTRASWRRSRWPTGSTCGSAATAPTSRPPGDGEPRANVPEDLPPDELDSGVGEGAAGQPRRRGDAPRHRPGLRHADRRQERPVRSLCDRGAARRRAQGAEAANVVAVQVDVLDTDHARRRAGAADAAAGSGRRPRVRRRDHRTERPIRAVPEEGQRLPVDRLGGAAVHDHARGGIAIYAEPKQRGRAAADPGRELGTDPTSGAPSPSRAAGSVTTSPTASTTRPCARATTRRRSRSSARPSCWPSGARRGRRRRRPRRPPRRRRQEDDAKKTTKKAAKKATSKTVDRS